MTDPGAATSTIALKGITKAFPGVVANDDITLMLYGGQVHCLLGENGAGKSTLISILAGLQLPDSGSIEIDGRPVSIGSPRIAKRLGIGVVHQHSTLVPNLTVIENLMLGEPGLLRHERRAMDRLEELSQLLGATIDPRTPAKDLGLGQQQQVEIAKAMWTGTRLLILDEPTSMLTPSAIESLAESLTRLTDGGLGVVFITHKLREAYQIGDCVTILRGGRNAGFLAPQRLASLSEDEAKSEILRAMFGEDLRVIGTTRDAQNLAGATKAHLEADSIPNPGAVRLSLIGATSGGRTTDTPIRDVTLEIRQGEIVGIAGIDGHGQSSLAEVVAGQRPLATGSIALDGAPITNQGVQARHDAGVRYVTDDRLHEGTVPNLSVSMNLVLKKIGQRPFWRFGQTDTHAIDAHARTLIDEYTIRTPSPRTRVATLSGGNIQKVLLARELGEGARVVVVNKPTAGLDLKTVGLVHDALKDFARGGGSVLLISTEMDELVDLSDRIAVMSRGRVVGVVENRGPDVAERVGAFMTGGSTHEDG
mgnify:CR=1 FL=1